MKSKTDVFKDFDSCLGAVCNCSKEERARYIIDPEHHFTRKRKLPMQTVMELVVTAGSESTKNVLDDYFAGRYSESPFKMDQLPPFESALTQQREKLKPEAFEDAMRMFAKTQIVDVPYGPCMDERHPNVRRVATDGTGVTYESTPALSDARFFHAAAKDAPAGTGTWEQYLTMAYGMDHQQFVDGVVSAVHDASEPDDLCVLLPRVPELYDGWQVLLSLDRNFAGYNNLAVLQESGVKYVMRVKDTASNGIASGLGLPDGSFDVDVKIRVGRTLPFTKNLPPGLNYRNIPSNQRFDFVAPGEPGNYQLRIRVVRFRLSSGEWECLFTNLPRDDWSTADVQKEYGFRWTEEGSFRSFKYTMGALSFHARKDYLVTQEIWAKMLLFDVCSAVVRSTVAPSTEPSAAGTAEVSAADSAPNSTGQDIERHILINFNEAAHVIRKDLISRKASDEALKIRIARYKETVILNRHEPRRLHRRRRFYLAYRAA